MISDYSVLPRQWLREACDGSDEYSLDVASIDDLLILVDRVVTACRNHPDAGRIDEATSALKPILSSTAGREDPELRHQCTVWLMRHMEHWFKAVWWVWNREDYEAARAADIRRYEEKKTRRFNLFAAITELDLLTIAEANRSAEEINLFSDPVRRLIFAAKETRNAGHDLEERGAVDAGPALMAVLCAPVIKHRESLGNILHGLVVRPFSLPPVRLQVLRSIAETRRAHLARFMGREEWLDSVLSRADSIAKQGGYLVLVGPEGQGKTALCAKISSMLRQETVLDATAPRVVREAPWLPGALLHFGKQSRSVPEIVELIVEQANVLLLRSIPFSATADADTVFPSVRSTDEASEATQSLTPITRRVLRERGSLSSFSMDYHRSRLVWALERLKDERGRAFLIVDAVDEITRRGEELAFLPNPLPRGCVVLLTVRSHLGLDKWLANNLERVEFMALGNFPRTQIAAITGVSDVDGRSFNDEVFDRSRGWAYMVSAVRDEVRRSDGEWQRVRVDGLVEAMLEAQAQKWVERDPLLRALLPVLALFEPCSALPVDALQGYLHCISQATAARFQIVDSLRVVGPQLDGLQSGSVKLAQSVLAHYVRETFLSRRDYDSAFRTILDWFVADEDIDATLVA